MLCVTCLMILVVVLLVYLVYKFNTNTTGFKICIGKHDHLDQNIWGPAAWEFLHTVAFAYPEKPSSEDKSAAKNFVESFACILPCVVCKQHFSENIKELPLNVASRKDFFEWTVRLHNMVNVKLNKPIWNLDSAFEKYDKIYSIHKN